jgi:hypothetical protein
MNSLGRRAWFSAAALTVAGLVAVPLASAASPAYPSKAKVYGKKMGEWVADWWQWVLSTPIGVNPFFDADGTNAGVGQRGKAWFLVGSDTGDATTRAINVPAGRPILIPVIATWWDNAGLLPSDWFTTDELYAKVAQFADGVDAESVVFTIDGVALTDIAKRRVKSIEFEYAVSPGSIAVGLGAEEGTIIYPAVSDGFWVMLRPLSAGNHTIHWEAASGGSSYDVTYNLTAVALEEP